MEDNPRIIRRSHGTKASGGGKKSSRTTYDHLPSDRARRLMPSIKVIAFDTVASLDAWQQLSDDQICEIWNAFLGEQHHLSDDDDLFMVVKRLVSAHFLFFFFDHSCTRVTYMKGQCGYFGLAP